MPLDQLLTRMRQENAEQIAAVLAEANADADRTREAGETARLWERSRRTAELEERLRIELAARIEALQREGFHLLLSARQRAVERVLDRVRQLMPELERDPAFLGRMEAELRDAFTILNGRSTKLCLSPAFHEYLADRIPPGVEVRSEPGASGFRLAGENGRVEIIGTASERVERATPVLRIAALRALESAGSP